LNLNLSLNNPIDVVDSYKYLGIILDQHLTYETVATTLAESGQRALGAVIAKYKKIHGLGYQTYSKLFHACVAPVLDYCSGVWGYKAFGKIDTVQHRAIRVYLGVHNFAPNAAITADMGWSPSQNRRKIEMLRLWNRLIEMNDNRLTKHIFQWDYLINKNNWCNDVCNILTEIGCNDVFNLKLPVNTSLALSKLLDKHCTNWSDKVKTFSKLRTYIEIKQDFRVEPYVLKPMSTRLRSILARFRCGILPLEIETRRFQPDLNRRREICKICKENVLEDEIHFFFKCNKYNNVRNLFLQSVKDVIPNLEQQTYYNQLRVLMQDEHVLLTCKFLNDLFRIRQNNLYEG